MNVKLAENEWVITKTEITVLIIGFFWIGFGFGSLPI